MNGNALSFHRTSSYMNKLIFTIKKIYIMSVIHLTIIKYIKNTKVQTIRCVFRSQKHRSQS